VTLAPGTRVGHYEIVAPLGAGGMGEVFRARDARLARDVAVKVLPARLSKDEEALARFEREARAVAALSHPNILSIFDFGRQDAVAYAVTELLDGETLRERLKGGALPLRKAIETAVQIAHGLSGAHEKGVVHRDLKPENLFVTRDGRVKILDFGLARHASETRDSDSGSPTEAHPTEPGTLLGTVGYMSPEQVRGQPVDHRSDIFSLGAVLFEMATGERAFRRDTAAETMTAILREDPLPPMELSSSSSRFTPGLERVLRHCLEKSPDERFQSARDLAFDLEALSGSTRSESGVRPGAASLRSRMALTLAGGLALLGAGFALGWLGRGSATPAPAPAQGFVVNQLTFQAGRLSYPSVSPDGKSFVYVAESEGDLDIHLQRIGGTNPVNLTADSPALDSEPAFSPDGTQIAFRSSREEGGLFLMGATGESVRRLTDQGFNPAWTPDGSEIVYSTASLGLTPYGRAGFGELWAVRVATGEKRQLTRGAPLDAVQPSVSPHGQRIAFWGVRPGGQRDIFTLARTGDAASLVSVTDDPDLDATPVWAPDGRSLYFVSDRDGTLGVYRLAIDEATGRATGSPQQLPIPLPFASHLSLTRDGRKLVLAGAIGTDWIERLGFDAARYKALGPAKPVFRTSRRIFSFAVSPDASRLAFTTGGRREDLYTLSADGTGLRQLTDDAFIDRGDPGFFPDGSMLFYSTRSGQYEAWRIRADGSGLTQLTRTVGDEPTDVTLSPDAKHLAVSMNRGSALVTLDPTGPVQPEPLADPGPGVSFQGPIWSRDGQRLAGELVPRGGHSRPAIYSLRSKTYKSLDLEAAVPYVWVNGDRGLLLQKSGQILALDILSGRVQRVLPLEPDEDSTTSPIRSVSLSADGRQLFVLHTGTQSDVWQVTLP
jgi:Tol biopolymer transport system component